MLAQLADRLILQPSRNPISAAGKVRRLLTTPHGFLEVWTQRVGALGLEEVDVFVLKFSGAGGRAERTSHHPLDAWSDLTGEVWSVNPHGYGGSSGPASLQTLAVAARAAYKELANVAAGRPLFVMGNSLGTVLALHLAATHRVDGLVLRNPPPLRQLIVGRHGWWNLWLGAMLVSTQVPDELCSIANARRCVDVPALFIGSVRDRIVPPHYQAQIVRAYAGPKRIMRLRKADHDAVMNAEEQDRYRRELRWLREQSRRSVETK
jgi:pimeloyl-ACP methyl ester carboxylesterase